MLIPVGQKNDKHSKTNLNLEHFYGPILVSLETFESIQ